jgi:hypothetical protein
MPSTATWHSLRETVHHNHPDCRRGARIGAESWRQGAAGKPLCEECRRLGADANGTGALGEDRGATARPPPDERS